MADRLGWTSNGGDTLGDVKNALAGRAFGDVPVVYAVSPAKITIDCSKGDVFTVKAATTTAIKFGNPVNFDVGSEVTLLISGFTSAIAPLFDTNYVLVGGSAATLTVPTAKSKFITFKYVAAKGKFIETSRTASITV